MKKEEVKACKIPGNARSVGTHWIPMHHPKPVHLATRSASSSTLPVTYPTVATQEVIRDLDPNALVCLKFEIGPSDSPPFGRVSSFDIRIYSVS